MNSFHEYLSAIRPLIRQPALEKAAGIPEKTLAKHFMWVDSDGAAGIQFPKQHIAPLIRALCIVCQQERAESDALAKQSADDFAEAMTTFLTTDTGTHRKQAV